MIDLLDTSSGFDDDKLVDYKKHIVSHKDIDKDLEDFLSGKAPRGFKIGVPALDDYFVLKKNAFYVLTGKKGQGKTTINQSIQVMFSIVNGLKWVVAFQENDPMSMKMNYMSYLLGDFVKDVRKNDPLLYYKALKWVEDHFVFLKVRDVKTATETTKYLIDNGLDVHALLLDPINSFSSGWKSTGNNYTDSLLVADELLDFVKNTCSVHLSQHPIMSMQRQSGAVSGADGEGGYYYNKASFTYSINKEKGSSQNEISVGNVRSKHTGGMETDPENPVIIHWSPIKIDIETKGMGNIQHDVIGRLRNFYDPLGIKNQKTPIPKGNIEDAF